MKSMLVNNPAALFRPFARTPSNEGIDQALLADHDRIRALIANIESNPATAPKNYPTISAMLKRHAKAEEDTLYNALQRIPGLGPLMDKSRREHATLEAMLKRLDNTSYAHPVWWTRFSQAVRALTNHLATEETEVFDDVRRRLSLPQQRALASRYRDLMKAKQSFVRAIGPRPAEPTILKRLFGMPWDR